MSVHATAKLLHRIKQQPVPAVTSPSTMLGNWYATLVAWRKPVVLFVNARTLLPVLTPLAPAVTVLGRFGDQLGAVLTALGAPPPFIGVEVDNARSGTLATTRDRRVVGSMVDFAFLADHHRRLHPDPDLVELSVKLAGTPCRPLDAGHGFPDRELAVLIATT
ncbi:hypothetical protein BH24ACT5_BH24ACT5_01490 [soil metagenome]